ncbi:MAG: DEAD/DEAH box helicase [Planctomycetota bacterium]
MMVLQGNWCSGRLHVWGMIGPASDAAALTAPGESGEERYDTGILPVQTPAGSLRRDFCDGLLSSGELRAAIGDLSPDGLLASVVDEASLTLWVPGETPDDCRPSFCRVTVPTLAFSPADTIDLLANLPWPLPQVCGDSLRYWSLLARYVVSLLAGRQFAPDVEERPDGTFAALWRPLVHDREELAWLERYAAVMPPVCSVAEDRSPIRLVEDFVGVTADALIRRTVAEDPFFVRIHERARKECAAEVRWLSALLGRDRIIRGDRDEIVLLADRIRTWVGRLEEGTSAAPLRLCFTLLEPEETAEMPGDGELRPSAPRSLPAGRQGWRLELELQTRDDPPQRFDVARVWSEPDSRPTLLGRHLGHRRDQLLAELARAKQVFPVLEDLPANVSPRVVHLTTTEAYAFITEWGPLLAAQGFGVLLPDWATRRERQLGMRLFVRPSGAGGASGTAANSMLGLEAVLDFDWRVAIGGMELSLAEFEGLVAQQTPLVKYGDGWLEVDAEGAGRALAFMRERPGGRISLGDALRIAYGAEDLDAGLPILGLSGGAWIGPLLREAPFAAIESLPQPASFRGTLRPYQRRGLDWLAFLDRYRIGACLADDMGLGKTIQLIALLLYERAGGNDVGPTLIFAPASVVGNWEREIERFTGSDRLESRSHTEGLESRSHTEGLGSRSHSEGLESRSGADGREDGHPRGLRVLVHHGSERLAGDDFILAAPQHDVVITTYALGYRDLSILRRVNWHRIVLDEAQKVKNPQAGQTVAIRLLPASQRVALTGTPIENHLSELWSIMEVLNPDLLGSAAQFRSRFAVPIEKLGDRERETQLRRMLQPFMLRRTKSDPGVVCDLPEKMEMRVFCNLTPEQAGLYQQVVDRTLGAIDAASGIRRRGLILSMLTRLKQVCNHPCHLSGESGPLDDRSGKCERLVEMLEEVLAEGDAALVFTQYRQMAHLLERLLVDRLRTEVLFLHGGTPAKRRTEMVERFQDPHGGVRIFLLSLKAGGLGLNLTAANHVFHFDRWWNPAVEAQATDRAHRIGQTRCVQVHKFVCIGTVEERIERMLESKRALAENIIGRGDAWLTGLSTEALREYVVLAREAVG